ncbi:MAG: dockerin type I domain-containing protein [Ruminococcus sp.]|nr:dockerin type I domain-containing protein [Ruminococcus sp.]MCD7800357.1 dockerin type I domain-containing protein [Ruminococcus sp.]
MVDSNFRKKIAFITTFALLVSSVSGISVSVINQDGFESASSVYAVEDITVTEVAGYEEGAYVEWTGSTSDEYSVYYKSGSGSYTQIDSMLIRQYSDHFRADVVGISAGTYTLKVVGKSSGEVETSTVTVTSYDRSGFAFSENSPNGTNGVGAYNNDGTLKSGTQVLYVTEDTKTTVTMDINGTTQTGIANITQQAKKCSVPICIRIIGTVTLDGLVSSDMSSAYALGVKEASNITIEGIGEDATLYGAGLAAFKCNSIEFRNLGLMLWGGGSDGDGITLKESVNVWIHDNDIFYGEAGSDSDQAKGDGSMDLKDDSQYITISYNHFWDSGKMSLCGMKSESGENWITYHHNWFDHSDSRHPRIRTMSVHIYNNYYDGNSKYGVGAALNSEAFVENNYFRNCRFPMLSSMQGSDILCSDDGSGTFSSENGGIIKSYGNYMEGQESYITYQEDSVEFDAYEASSRDEQVPSTVTAKQGGKTYSNFDTDDTIMYDYTPDDAEDVPSIVMSKAGRLNGGDFDFDFDDSVDDSSYAVNTDLMNQLLAYESSVVAIGSGNFTSTIPSTDTTTTTTTTTTSDGNTTDTPSVSGGNVHNFTTDGTSSTYYTITGNLSTSKGTMEYDGLTLTQCLKLESSTSITFTASSDTTLLLVTNTATYINIDGESVTLDSSGVTSIPITAGSHTITKGDSGNLFYMATGDTSSATETSVTTAPPTTTDEPSSSDTSTSTGVSTIPSVVADAIYCSPNGTGDGSTIDTPTSVLNAISQVQAGGVIYLLDGTYNFSETILIDEDNCGTADAYKTIMAYPENTGSVVWDFSAMEVDGSNRGVVLDGDYWHFYGFEITKAGDNGMLLSGNNNVIQMMVFNNNQDTGLQISRYNTSADTIDLWPSNNLILNCTSKNNCDDATMENADGFAAKLTCGEGNVFDGCMAYNNSDDGWDLFAKTETGSIGVVTIQNCIAFRNGYTEDGRGYGDCDGNGFKLGGSGVGTAHVVVNCLAFENLHCGFTDNNNPNLESLTNCTSFNNDVGGDGKPNFSCYRCTDDGCDFSGILSYNNASAVSVSNDKFVGTMENSIYYNAKFLKVTDKVDVENGYKGGEEVTLSDSDFVSVIAPEMGEDFHTLWRNADGSINTQGFMQLISDSSLGELGADLVDYTGESFDVPQGDDSLVSDTVTTTDDNTDNSNTSTDPSITSEGDDTSSTSSTSGASVSGETLLGDVNVDGSIKSNDLLLLKKYLLGLDDLSGQELVNADVNVDGDVKSNDLLLVKKYLLGLIDEF